MNVCGACVFIGDECLYENSRYRVEAVSPRLLPHFGFCCIAYNLFMTRARHRRMMCVRVLFVCVCSVVRVCCVFCECVCRSADHIGALGCHLRAPSASTPRAVFVVLDTRFIER